MSTTLVTNHPDPGSHVTVAYPGEPAYQVPPDRVAIITTLGGAQLTAREARMVASRLIRAAAKARQKTY